MMLVAARRASVSDGPLRFIEPDFVQDPLSAGAIVAAIAVPNQLNAVRRADHLIVDTELTERILQARELRAKLGTWPDRINGAGFEQSRLANGRWIYSVDRDGRMSIAFSRPLRWEESSTLVLPLEYESDSR